MSIKVLLVVQDGEACRHYTEVLLRVGVEVEIVPSLDMVGALFPQSAYNGLLVDVPTMMRSSALEKALLQNLLLNIPTLRLRWDAASNSIRALTTRRQPHGSGTLASFLIETCGTFPPRRIRCHPRLEISYPVLLSQHKSFPPAETQKSSFYLLAWERARLQNLCSRQTAAMPRFSSSTVTQPYPVTK